MNPLSCVGFSGVSKPDQTGFHTPENSCLQSLRRAFWLV
ncbi:hypothetical protein PCH70_13420 [Pseudomonas cichorii JBC1]|nr:hypothetical protein PCH70_13420 [Pseudomonas cichorii JBC1]